MELESTIIVGKHWRGAELCMACAQPIMEFLKNNKLLAKAGLQNLQTPSEVV
jgi:hypothetical protein